MSQGLERVAEIPNSTPATRSEESTSKWACHPKLFPQLRQNLRDGFRPTSIQVRFALDLVTRGEDRDPEIADVASSLRDGRLSRCMAPYVAPILGAALGRREANRLAAEAGRGLGPTGVAHGVEHAAVELARPFCAGPGAEEALERLASWAMGHDLTPLSIPERDAATEAVIEAAEWLEAHAEEPDAVAMLRVWVVALEAAHG